MGIYESKVEKTMSNLLSNQLFASDLLLDLKEDSSFRFQTCGDIYIGKWNQSGDSLILNCESTCRRTREVEKEEYIKDEQVMKFQISENSLRQDGVGTKNGKKVKLITYLKKIKS